MRVPITGGRPQLVSQVSASAGWGLRFDCPGRAGSPCLLAQFQGEKVWFRPFDPLAGFDPAARPVAVAEAEPADGYPAIFWAVAPDGSSLAWAERGKPNAILPVVPLASGAGAPHDVELSGWSHIYAINWSADSRGWFVTLKKPARWTLLYADAGGHARVLYEARGAFTPDIFPSPDGRLIAFWDESSTSNVWLLENL